MYIKINGSNKKYSNVSIIPFSTQHGNSAVRLVGEGTIPKATNKGFIIYDDDDAILGDYTDYKYLYKPNEYTTVEEELESAQCSFEPLPESSYNKLSKRVSRLSSKVYTNANDILEMSDAICEYTADTEDRITDVEDSLCELSEIINPETLEEEE